MSANIKTVRQLKEDLLKEQARPPGEGRNEKILDLLRRLDKVPMDLNVLAETLIGASVSKLKSHDDEDVSTTAKSLVKKWKTLAKSQGATSSGESKKSSPALKSPSRSQTPAAKPKPRLAAPSRPSVVGPTSITTDEVETEWQGLPTLRLNICKKLHSVFLMSQADLAKDLNESALKQLSVSRASEVEAAVEKLSRGVKQVYADKARSLVFNLKKNASLRERVIVGQVSAATLSKMSSEQLLSDEKAKERNETVGKLQDSRRLDWEQANETKINEMCGIKGDLLKASLFTCGRCKSTKTTSTQKQTRSADEPMTVFVLCMNCGNRWKC